MIYTYFLVTKTTFLNVNNLDVVTLKSIPLYWNRYSYHDASLVVFRIDSSLIAPFQDHLAFCHFVIIMWYKLHFIFYTLSKKLKLILVCLLLNSCHWRCSCRPAMCYPCSHVHRLSNAQERRRLLRSWRAQEITYCQLLYQKL